MKYSLVLAFCLISSVSFSQNSYGSLWKEVEQLESDGLTHSALKKVEFIANKALKENNKVQHIKTLLYESKYALILEEDAQLAIANKFKKRIAESASPEKNILQNLLANLYWQYFQQNRYRFYDRTPLATKDSDDFRTWDLETLFREIDTLFRASLENSQTLQAVDLNSIKELLVLPKDTKTHHPTLFDFLSHKALDFYKTDENSIAQPAYKFELDKPKYLSITETFIKLNLVSKDSTSIQLQALKIYQNLLRSQVKNASPKVAAQTNIERLKFVRQYAGFNNPDSLYFETLQAEKNILSNSATSVLYDFEIAQLYFKQGQQYNSNSEENRWKLKKALTLCSQIIQNAPDSITAKNAGLLKSQIEQASLQLMTENYIPTQQASRILVTYKNIPSLEFRIYEFNKSKEERLSKIYRQEEQLDFIQTLKLHKRWTAHLPNEGDYQQHSTEIVVPELPPGMYLVLAKQDDTTFAFKTIQATAIGLVTTSTPKGYIYQAVDRTNGHPLSKAKVTITYQKDYKKQELTVSLITDALGKVYFKKTGDYLHNIQLKITHNKETAYFNGGNLYKSYDQKEEAMDYKGFLFTDRSIYRPGQTVYFKGIVIRNKNNKSEIVANERVYVTLHNTNREEIKELELKTNDFGSVSGEFILPSDGINGLYSIEMDGYEDDFQTEHSFSVEEYKRPKFEATFNPVTETYKVNDSVTVKGLAQAYAGSSITDAKVTYRVHRKVEYPRWVHWYRPAYYGESQEISHGETTTNDKGEFEITFQAIPARAAKAENMPVFRYEITVDVTDINGETRSANTSVNVGYHTMTATIVSATKIDKSKKDNTLSIEAKNLNGQDVTASGIITAYKLLAPKEVLRPRPWQEPDYQKLSEEEFKTLFPHEAYKDESNQANWEKGQLVFKETFDTSKSKELALGHLKKWKTGLYVIELESQDKFGQTVKDQLRVTVVDSKKKTVLDNEMFSASLDQQEYQVGETIALSIASAARNMTVYVEVEKNKTLVNSQKLTLNNEVNTLEIPVNKDDIGGFVVHVHYAIYNYFGYQQLHVAVPYPKTDLEIETLTFRDKLQPGEDETWSFKIKGPKGEQVSAELLASMYDASLDQFRTHNWTFNPLRQPSYHAAFSKTASGNFGTGRFRVYVPHNYWHNFALQSPVDWNWFGLHFGNYYNNLKRTLEGRVADLQIQQKESDKLEEVVAVGYGTQEKDKEFTDTKHSEDLQKENDSQAIQIRKNLQETAFFFPKLQTDKEGNVTFGFTSPEALTQWNLQLLAHTKELNSQTKTLETVTQKELMVIPNAPRFLREGDTIVFSAKIANLSDGPLSGQAELQLFDAVSGKNITSDLVRLNTIETFSVEKENNTQMSWELSIPDTIQAVQYKILAKAGDFSDGEQNALPVLSNRMLVTETLPMWIRSNETRTFALDKLKTVTSTTLKSHKLTLEVTSNPAWYAVQALPYLMEYPYDCNEQTFGRYYANALASHIANSNPRIEEVFNQWKNSDALISNLEKNQELKSLMIQETPWLREAQNETEQKKRIGLLFDLNKLNNELNSALRKLKNNQLPDGSWPWFNGGYGNRFITQHILAGFGHLIKLGVIPNERGESQMIENALKYLDAQFVKEYKDLTKYSKDIDLSKDHLSPTQLHYLYMRSFFPEIKKSKETEDITQYYYGQIKSYWLSRSLYAKGLMALVTYRANDTITSGKILTSLKENSITSDELGMYWKENTASWHWYQAPIETQALLIEAFSEVGPVIQSEAKNSITIDNLKIWLLKNKQTNQWETTKATTEAVYALLLQGSDWLSVTDAVEVLVGNQKIEPSKLEDVKVEAGTGYYKTAWNGNEVTPEMATVSMAKKGDGIAWGSLYWQYFENLDKITSAETPLKLKKKLFLKTNTDRGELLTEITEDSTLKVGDLVRVRIELRSNRTMEFIHMKDMRASGLEPTNVLSQYKWQDGLGYYESTKDAATNFFFDYLPKGVYVFEYNLRVNNAGNMSNGITTIQSMYAPEFASHSEGVRLKVD